MRKHRELIIFALVITTAAVLAVLGMEEPAKGKKGYLLSAEPRRWLGAVAPSSSKGLSVFGIHIGDDAEALQKRLPPDYSISQVGDTSIFKLRGPGTEIFFTGWERIEGIWAYDLGALYKEGRPVSKAGKTRIGTSLQEAGLIEITDQTYTDGVTRLDCWREGHGRDEVDFLYLAGNFAAAVSQEESLRIDPHHIDNGPTWAD